MKRLRIGDVIRVGAFPRAVYAEATIRTADQVLAWARGDRGAER